MRPLIAVPGIPLGPGTVKGWHQGGYGVPSRYLEALDRAGADGAVLMPQALDGGKEAAERLARFDGLLLVGGGDIDPGLYGADAVPEISYVSPARDGYEIPLVLAAVEQEMPTLAICRGAQVVNVALGGTLHQHITDGPGVLAHRTPEGDAGLPHRVRIEPGSRLAGVLGTEETVAYSWHHQALDRIAPGLTVVASADDGIVEAVEHERGWVLAIQWHPEVTAGEDPVQQRLFDAFVAEAAGGG